MNFFCSGAAVKDNEVGDTDRAGATPACVTLIVRIPALPLTVMVAVRCVVDVLAATVTYTSLLFRPVGGETVSQDWSLLTAQFEFEVILNCFCSLADEKFIVLKDRSNVEAPPACVTWIIRVISPPLIVIVANRTDADELAVTLTVIMSRPVEPERGETVSQAWLLLTDQLTLA